MSIEQKFGNNKQEEIKTNEVVKETVPVEVPNVEEEQAKAEIKAQKEKENNEQIGKIKEELMKHFEGGEFGEARIDNPKILDMIAEIEFGATIKDEETREQAIQTWKRNVQGQFNDAIKELSRKRPMESLIYGRGGKDRFTVNPKGEVFLVNNPNAKLIATEESLQRAIQLGMKITE